MAEDATTTTTTAPGADRPAPSEVEQLRAQLEALTTERDQARQALTDAAARYRAAVIAGSPELPAALIVGDTFDQVDAALAVARATAEAIKAHQDAAVEAARLGFRPPAGGGVRQPPDFSAMSPAEKIKYGLNPQG